MKRAWLIGLSVVLGPWQSIATVAYAQDLLPMNAQPAGKSSLVELAAGHSSLINFKEPIQRASVNDSTVADVVVVSPTELLVQANRPGSTSVIVWKEGQNELYTVRVEADLEALRKAVRSVHPMEQISIQSSSGNIILSGIVTSQAVAEDLIAVASSYGLPVVNLLKVPEDPLDVIVKKFFPKEKIEVHQSAKGTVLTGNVSSPEVLQKVDQLAKVHDPHVSNLLGLQNPTLDELLTEIVPDETFKATRSGDSVILSGIAKNFDSLTKAEQALATTAANVVNLVEIPEREQVLIEVRFAEVNRTFTKELGIDWFVQDNDFTYGGFGGGALSPQTPTTPQFGRIDNSEISLNQSIQQFFEYRNTIDLSTAVRMLEDKGLLRMLAEPNLIALSGEEASFLAGGEFPIPVVQEGSSITIEFKEFGVRLDFKPEVKPDGLIKLAVQPEVSILDFGQSAVTIGGFQIPALITRKADTTVQLREHETLVIGGLLSQIDTNSDEQVPFLGSVPVIGKLFQSQNFVEEETELLVMVTPRLMKPAKIDLPKKYSHPEDLGRVFKDQLNDPPYPDDRGEAIRKAIQGIKLDDTEPEIEDSMQGQNTGVLWGDSKRTEATKAYESKPVSGSDVDAKLPEMSQGPEAIKEATADRLQDKAMSTQSSREPTKAKSVQAVQSEQIQAAEERIRRRQALERRRKPAQPAETKTKTTRDQALENIKVDVYSTGGADFQEKPVADPIKSRESTPITSMQSANREPEVEDDPLLRELREAQENGRLDLIEREQVKTENSKSWFQSSSKDKSEHEHHAIAGPLSL